VPQHRQRPHQVGQLLRQELVQPRLGGVHQRRDRALVVVPAHTRQAVQHVGDAPRIQAARAAAYLLAQLIQQRRDGLRRRRRWRWLPERRRACAAVAEQRRAGGHGGRRLRQRRVGHVQRVAPRRQALQPGQLHEDGAEVDGVAVHAARLPRALQRAHAVGAADARRQLSRNVLQRRPLRTPGWSFVFGRKASERVSEAATPHAGGQPEARRGARRSGAGGVAAEQQQDARLWQFGEAAAGALLAAHEAVRRRRRRQERPVAGARPVAGVLLLRTLSR